MATDNGDARQATSNNTTSSSTAWDLETFLSNRMPEDFDDANAKDVAEKLFGEGYDSELLMMAQREGLEQAGLKCAEIDAILYWQKNGEKRGEKYETGKESSLASDAATIEISCCKLSKKFLEAYDELGSYVAAATICANNEEFKSLLSELGSDGERDDSISSQKFSCIIAPSGTGKTQLAATAAQTSDWNVVYFYTGTEDSDTAQSFYKPHVQLSGCLFRALAAFESTLHGDTGAWTIERHTNPHPLFTLLFRCFFPDDQVGEMTVSSLKKRMANGSKKPLVFLDEIPSSRSSKGRFGHVILLRNVLRAAGVSPILMSTHTGSINDIEGGSDSRTGEESQPRCRVFVKLPNYQAPASSAQHKWRVETERPLIAAMMDEMEEKTDISIIVDAIQKKLQHQKAVAWLDDPALQLCQLFRTKDSSGTLQDCYKHRVVGHHFGHISPASEGPFSVDRYNAGTWVTEQVVQFVDPEKEPVLFLALTTWKMDHLQDDISCSSTRFFPLMMRSKRRRLSVRGAYEASSYLFTKPVGTDNDKASKLDGDDLEVLALAAITLASLQQLENGIFSSAIPLPTFLANVFHFMSATPDDHDNIDHRRMAATAASISGLLKSTKFCGIEIPTCPSYGSSFVGPWGSQLDASKHGEITRPEDKEGRDGYMKRNGSTVLHVECKDLKNGLTTEVFKKVYERMRAHCKVSLLFTSDINGLFQVKDSFMLFAGQHGFDVHDVCFLVLQHGQHPYWLRIQRGSVILSPNKTTDYLMVLVATGAVQSSRSISERISNTRAKNQVCIESQ